MPLYDHFTPPLSKLRHWHAFHNAWATYIASSLNRQLPRGYIAEPNVMVGIEIDVATYEEVNNPRKEPLSVPALAWTPSVPTATIPFQITTDVFEVAIYSDTEELTLVGAIELVSPANKDRPQSRDEFVTKCAQYLRKGAGVIIVDVVTTYKSNLHNMLISRFADDDISPASNLYASAYRPVERDEHKTLDVWVEALRLKGDLPTLPLWLSPGPYLVVDLNTTYQLTCEELRIKDVLE